MRSELRIVALTTAACLSHAVAAADYSTPAQPARAALHGAATDKLSAARALVAAGQWPGALAELKRVNDSGSADWNNLMGYALRKSSAPDLTRSERYYEEALRIDPHHRNALEYSAELSLMKGDLGKALARLATLADECGASCEQYVALNSEIERYRVAGNKFVPKPW